MNKRLFHLPSTIAPHVRNPHPSSIEFVFATLVLRAPLTFEFHGCMNLQTGTGEGCEKNDELPFIFDRFYRTHHDASLDNESNSLRMAIVKSIVEQHKGMISVESEPGEGSCFNISLPLSQPSASQAASEELKIEGLSV